MKKMALIIIALLTAPIWAADEYDLNCGADQTIHWASFQGSSFGSIFYGDYNTTHPEGMMIFITPAPYVIHHVLPLGSEWSKEASGLLWKAYTENKPVNVAYCVSNTIKQEGTSAAQNVRIIKRVQAGSAWY